MTDESDEERLVRFDFPPGVDAAALAKALTEARTRIMAEHAAKWEAAEQEAPGRAAPDASSSPGSGRAEERPPEPPVAEA